jgi:Rrf2 family transcriptional regulator, nitric oxide-sensitive transcriptional repressor
MISRTNEYALRVMVFLAAQEGAACGTRDIAAATHVPVSYLSKILLTLVKEQFVRSQRGLHGGFVLARDPAEISVFDVVAAIDPLPRIRVCPLNLAAHSKQLCPLHKELDNAFELVEQAFRRATLAGLVDASVKRKPLCPTEQKVQVGIRRRPAGRA